LDVFETRRQIIDDHASYVRSFFTTRDPRVEALVENALTDGQLWPDPLLQLSPSFQLGEPLDKLIAASELHAQARRTFAVKSEEGTLRLRRHQVDGIRAARAGASYVLTTGTGSDKSLGYMVPIVDHVLRTPRAVGIKAIVYPMNALANSQRGELERDLCREYPRGAPPVTFARYTGQESDDERKEIIETPPEIVARWVQSVHLVDANPPATTPAGPSRAKRGRRG
jgi:ATP-dependent helicase YprA (DUF1998 family)